MLNYFVVSLIFSKLENKLDVKSFKDKLPSCIEQNPQFQHLVRYPVSGRAFDDPILFLAGLQSSWEHGQQRPAIFVGGKEMSFRNFIYTEEGEDLTFLPKDFSPGFNTYPSVSINMEPVMTDKEPAIEPATKPVNERVGTTADSGGVPKEILLLFTLGVLQTALGRGSAKQGEDDTPVLSISNDDEGLEDCLELKDATTYHLMISAITPPAWKGFLDNHLDVDLLDLHDRCYARQVVMDNAVNRRSCEPLEVIEKLRGEAEVMRAKELAYEEECEGLQAKCEAAITNFNKNPVVLLLREKMSLLAIEAKDHKGNLDRWMLESLKWLGYQEIEEVKHDRREVVSNVVPYACMELLHSDQLGRLVRKLLNEYVANVSAFASVGALLLKKPPTLQKHVPLRTQIHVPSSQLATLSFAPSSKPMSPPADIMKPSLSLNE
ncbi:hypothetical protein Tco_1178000 [Tanacetum coccineum]